MMGLRLAFAGAAILGAAVVIAVRFAGSAGPDHAAAIARGGDLYQQRCAGCHGTQLEGGVAPSLKGVTDRYRPGKIERIATRGKGRRKTTPMPGGLANPEEAKAIARWLAAQS